MSEIALPGRALAVPQHQAAGSSAPGTVADPPAGVLKLPQGSLLHGVVSGQAGAGHLLVQTDQGTLDVATKLPLGVGREVALQIRSVGSQLHITILPIEGHNQTGGLPRNPAPAQAPLPSPAGQPDELPLPGRAAPPSQGAIPDPPPTAAHLPAGSQLAVTVLNREADGSYLLRSEYGTLRLNTEANLPAGTKLTLQVRQSVSELQVLVLSRPTNAPGAASAAALSSQGPGHAVPTADHLEVGPLLRALVISPPGGRGAPPQIASAAQPPGSAAPTSSLAASSGSPTASSPPTGPAAIPTASASGPAAGSVLTVRLLQILPPSPQAGSASPGLMQATGSAAQGPGAPQPIPGGGVHGATAPFTNTATPQNATMPSAGLAGIGPDALARATDLSAAARHGETPAVLQGRVLGHASNGQPLLETPLGTIQLAVKAELPVGARLLLSLPQGLPEAQAAVPLASAGAENAVDVAALAKRWPAMESLLVALDEAGLQTQATASSQPGPSIPQPGARLASGLLFFITALTGGDPGAWLDGLMGGRAAGLLEFRGRQDLLGRLRGDLARLAGLGDAAGPDWRLLPVPFFDGQQVQQLRFFLRRQGDGEEDAAGAGADEAATRFLLDVELTRLGALQFDGLVRPKRFDMVLRSRAPLPDWMQHDILKIFESANGGADAKGRLSFQASGEWTPVEIAEAPDAPDLHV